MTVKTEGILLADSAPGLRNLARALLSNTVRTPKAELFGEFFNIVATSGWSGVR